MLALIRLTMSIELLAAACEQLLPHSHLVLPIGGSQLAQLGLILIFLVVYAEVRDYISHRKRRRTRSAARDRIP